MAQLSGTYANTWQSALAPEWSRKAFELRDRVSERERYVISWRYYRDATQAWDKGLELARSWTAAYPRESTAFNSLGCAAWALGQYQQAIAPLRESIRLDPRFFAPRLNLLWTLTALNQFDEARKVLDDARAANIDHIGFRADGLPPGVYRQRHGEDDARAGRSPRETGRSVGVQLAAAHIGLWRPHRRKRTRSFAGASRRRARQTSPNCPACTARKTPYLTRWSANVRKRDARRPPPSV